MKIKIGARIKELRKQQNATQEQLAEALGITNQAISKWESESGYPDIEYIIPIANFFKVSANYLLDNGGELSVLNINNENGEGKQMNCSFCNKSNEQVKKMIAGPVVETQRISICNECILVCVEILM